jgi:hypothetical protein
VVSVRDPYGRNLSFLDRRDLEDFHFDLIRHKKIIDKFCLKQFYMQCRPVST